VRFFVARRDRTRSSELPVVEHPNSPKFDKMGWALDQSLMGHEVELPNVPSVACFLEDRQESTPNEHPKWTVNSVPN
jgi:hypothetical protein